MIKGTLLLTATPHSEKDDEFRSLLGLLNKKFGQLDFENISPNQRKELPSTLYSVREQTSQDG